LALGAFERAHEPKKLVIYEGDHFDAYAAAFETASSAAEDWFLTHLKAEKGSANSIRRDRRQLFPGDASRKSVQGV
jgi:hypothetical protein